MDWGARGAQHWFAIALLTAISTLVLLAHSDEAEAADPPVIDDDLIVAYYGDLVTVEGSSFGAPGPSRHLVLNYGDMSVPVGSTSPLVKSWTDTAIELFTPVGVLSGTLHVVSDGVASNAADLLIYRYSSFSIPPSIGTQKYGLTLALAPNGTIWLNQEFHVDLKSFKPGANPEFSLFRIPQVSGGIFASMFFDTDRRWEASVLGEDIAVDSSGDVWLTQGGSMFYPDDGAFMNTSRVVRYRPSTGQFSCYTVPIDNAQVMGLLVDEARSLVWYTEAGFEEGAAITSFDPAEADANCLFDPYSTSPRPPLCSAEAVPGCHMRYALPNPITMPAHLALDSEDNIWFAGFFSNTVGRLSPETGEVVELPLPPTLATSGPGYMAQTSGPWELSFDDNGDLWVSEFFDATVSRVRPALMDTADCLHLDPTGANPCIEEMANAFDEEAENVVHSLAAGANGSVWFGVEQVPGATNGWTSGGRVGVLIPERDASFLLPNADGVSSISGILQDRASHQVWFVQPTEQRVGRLQELGFGDNDGDGFDDVDDVCPIHHDPGQENSDGDFFGNACEVYENCPDYVPDGQIMLSDILYVIYNYRLPRPEGSVYTATDIIRGMLSYGQRCSAY
jgi:streptogramin lyase